MRCCICGKRIADCWPPLCADPQCEYWFRAEVEHDKAAREEVERDEWCRHQLPKNAYNLMNRRGK